MFTNLKNIDIAFKHIKVFSICLIVGNCLSSGFCIYKYYQYIDQKDQRIHIIYNGKLLEAFASDKKTNLPVELRDHIKTFHADFFNQTPDEEAIKINIKKALYLADQSAKKQYDNLTEAGYYNNIISANLSQQIEVDSIKLDIEQSPYTFTYYGTQKLMRSSNTTFRRLITHGKVRDLNMQTDKNPHGFLIQDWEILENSDLTKN